jgi:phosphomannomutase
MQRYNLKKLQHGSDIRGITIEGVPDEQVNPTPEMATILGQAFVSLLVQKVNKSAAELTIAIGHDCRLSGPILMQAVIAGITSVCSPGDEFEMASTPAKTLSIPEQFLEEAQYCSNTVRLS